MRHSSISVGDEEQLVVAGQATKHNSWHWAASLWCRTDPSYHKLQEGHKLFVTLPFASLNIPKIIAMTPLGATIMLSIPQGSGMGMSGSEEHCFSLTCTVPFLSIQSKATATETSETANGVSTGPMSAQAREDLTFIHICRGRSNSSVSGQGCLQ